MTRAFAAALVAAALLLFPADATWAQTPPQPTPTPPPSSGTAPLRPPRPRPPDTPMATICSTSEGWCPIKPVVAPGTPCECFLPPDIRLPGVARFFLYEEPVSPYLNPHRN